MGEVSAVVFKIASVMKSCVSIKEESSTVVELMAQTRDSLNQPKGELFHIPLELKEVQQKSCLLMRSLKRNLRICLVPKGTRNTVFLEANRVHWNLVCLSTPLVKNLTWKSIASNEKHQSLDQVSTMHQVSLELVSATQPSETNHKAQSQKLMTVSDLQSSIHLQQQSIM